jgi:hypothetical protein
MTKVNIPEWFKVGAKAYMGGVTPAYTIMDIKEDYWTAKDNFGELGNYPLDEVISCWSPVLRKDNIPKINEMEKK